MYEIERAGNMRYQYNFTVQNSAFCGVFTYATYISDVKLPEDEFELEEVLKETEAFKEAAEYVAELVRDETDSDEDEEEVEFFEQDVMYYIEDIEVKEIE
jgi:hypothetical protein